MLQVLQSHSKYHKRSHLVIYVILVDQFYRETATNAYQCRKCVQNQLSVCFICKKAVEDKAFKALGKEYHMDCFKCAECKKGFPEGKFVEHGERFYHSECYQKAGAGVKCVHCNKNCGDEFYQLGEKTYHVRCYDVLAENSKKNLAIKKANDEKAAAEKAAAEKAAAEKAAAEKAAAEKAAAEKAAAEKAAAEKAAAEKAAAEKAAAGKAAAEKAAAEKVAAEKAAAQKAAAEKVSLAQSAAPSTQEEKKTAEVIPTSTGAGGQTNSSGEPIYPYSSLIDNDKCPKGVDLSRKEAYLSDAEFAQIFGTDKKTFSALPKWKQADQKKKVKLFQVKTLTFMRKR
eukprot:TRINITY_DN4950_c0_g2_i1.p1 TRINITY_DN4950_c0_g2~~TRINITY_DN4950_c0_g2_i1.p1  ORF type:complete len:342 (+),score=60.69 TRINITY_DN4950_c0_g2_i1:446-1471(+)